MAKKISAIKWTLSSLLLSTTTLAYASAFQLLEQDVSSLGTAYSGTAAVAQDISTAFYNPAGLTYLDQKAVAQSFVFVSPSMKVTASSAASNTGVTPEGRSVMDPSGAAVIPALHYGARVTDRLVFGLSIAPPFGMKTNYDRDTVARYAASLSEVQVIGIAPSFAYEYDDNWSFAFGGDAQYLKARLNARVGSGLIHTDGYQKNSADDWAYGWHAGLLYRLNDATRFGLSYRSLVRFEARGESKSYLGGLATQQEVTAAVDTPESLTISAYHEFDDRWAAMADVSWTRWNRFDVLQLEYSGVHSATGARTTNVTEVPMYFKNTVRYALGGQYQYDNHWLIRFGVAQDPTPTRGIYRTARVPDADRRWVALGAQYQWSKDIKIDLGYAHLFFKEVDINDSGPISANSGLNVTAVNLQAHYKTSADLLGLQVQWDFD